MPKSLRVKLEPVFGSPPGGPNGVTGVRLVLTRHGPGFSKGVIGTAVPAKVKFFARLFEKARTFEAPAPVELGAIEGTVTLAPAASSTFALASGALDALAADPAAQPTLVVGSGPRTLALHLEPPSFTGAPSSPLPRLQLPEEADGKLIQFVELEVVLEVAGAVEADLGTNDVLDVPLSPRPIFGLRVVDDLGVPLETSVELTAAGVTETLQTDGEGWVRIDSLGATVASAKLAAPDAVLAELKTRWNEPRPGGRIHPAPGFTILDPRAAASATLTLTERLHTLSIQPRAVQARLFGMFFDTDKSFLLPGAIPSIRGVKQLYDENPNSTLLVVGHTDTSGEPSLNDPLSVERAESVAAFLKDEVDVWAGRYSTSIREGRRWGSREDGGMIKALQVLGPKFDGSDAIDRSDAVRWYQEFHNALPEASRAESFATLEVDGIAGPETRKQLIGDYMHLDGTTLPEEIELVTHGCGENFPVDDGALELDESPRNQAVDPVDRRVELFFFDKDFGIQPPPPGKNSKPKSKEYPEWRRRSRETRDFSLDTGNLAGRIPTRFSRSRTFPKPSALPFLKEVARRLSLDPELSLVLVGHADPSGTDAANLEVSRGRAEAVRAWLLGDREFFLARFDDAAELSHWDWEEAQWMLHLARVGGAPCYVGEADGFPGTRTEDAVGAFQLGTDDLPVSYALDRPTLERLVDTYLAAFDGPRPSADRVAFVAGGSWHPPLPLGPDDPGIDLDSPDLRRVEAFLFASLPNPPVANFPANRAPPTVYVAWTLQVQATLVAPPAPFVLQVHDPDRKALANSTLVIAREDPETEKVELGAVTTSGAGVAELTIPPGIYEVQIQFGGDAQLDSFVVDLDESCGVAIALERKAGLDTQT